MQIAPQYLRAAFLTATKTLIPSALTMTSGAVAVNQFASGNKLGGTIAIVLGLVFGASTALQGRGLESSEIELDENDQPRPPER